MDDLGGEDVEDVGDLALGDLLSEQLHDFLSDGFHLRGHGVARLSLLAVGALGEGNCEEPEEVAVLGLQVAVGFDEGLPLLNEEAQLVSGGVESVEAGLGGLSVNIIDNELDLSLGVVGVTGCEVSLEVGDDSALDGGFDLDWIREWEYRFRGICWRRSIRRTRS